ncbi:hypothetical protein N7450_008925 [Penicillium hetheringtonii]|uniref:Atos-like conserved domain-containing protein n=1 Tax=Penicillium hetheringtonii TaxID=911720 RepID=A0AAD6GPT4_9EURO|nr:hypothetical protein N7450_008925 [Penicillium hetheringtonii]
MQEMEELGSPADIQRPRSALHSGDFREGIAHETSESPRIPFPQRFSDRSSALHFHNLGHHQPHLDNIWKSCQGSIARVILIELRSESANESSRASSQQYRFRLLTTDRTSRGKRFGKIPSTPNAPTETFRQLQESSSPTTDFVDIHSPCPSRQQDGFYSYHCSPRRSLTSAYSLQLASNVNTPAYRARRPSFASDISPKPHAPMVGSYEESILRGRMSMNPSKPLDFTAQIGVLGKGKCKGHLKCPPHVTVPFPAFFYSYPTSGNGRSISDDSPSPYVGQIDLENSLPKDDTNTTRRRRRHASPSKSQENNISETNATQVPTADTQRRREKKNRRGESPKSPPRRTAVKLFLVPYDLEDMEPGTKTFIRQRSYSAGPVLDMPLSARKNYGTDRPEASLNATEDPQDKPTLRYLIHLNVCCPARGRFYLHSSIRVVFANRVPDGKEKLRNEIQLPEPRYSPYKPSRESTISSSAGARLAIDKSSRRRSVGQGSAVPLLRPHATSPGETSSYWSPGQSLDVLSLGESPHFDTGIYNKLNKDDLGYGGYPYPSTRNGSENGESLLAKRLRGLDVQRRERFDNS